jgi:2-polyprenyl-3-methyl-5-hydroxy-6-metoxy-1,4-benzoquinol methylase
MFEKIIKIIKKSPFQKKFLSLIIWLNYRSYSWVKKLIVSESGSHPKHVITNYHKFFLDNISISDKILDVGCCSGEVANDLAQKAELVIGVDIRKDYIEDAKAKYHRDNLRFFEGDASKLDLNSLGLKEFDAIILSNILEHLNDRVTFLRGLAAVSNKILLRVPMLDRDWLVVWKKENGYPYFLDPEHCIEYTRDI